VVNEKQRAESLVLSGCGHIAVIRQMIQKGGRFAFFHLGGMAFGVKENEFPSPSDIGLFRMNAIVLQADHFPDLVQELHFAGASVINCWWNYYKDLVILG
jgi:hypothetical protein